ncbi:Serine/threonine protein kinase PrkC, regulator of stationary phase [hydrothermal vent metagenome]|uniref:Serine/threonine protein kinase PrkC, regulator of stationary phase n=1 Tax=hydrothermal vent metagenome TaxID=652676 RepID=A0A3B1CNF9_9ZZZZ
MGIVYKGLDPKINRPVALKVIRSGLGSSKSADQKQALDRFYIEAQSAGQLSHHNIVTIYDVGEESTNDGDIVYIAMEYIAGKGLDHHIKSDTFSALKDKIRIIRQVAVGLDYAHKRDIVHRDVKPANIILTQELEPKLMDFGLARFSDSSLTMSGAILGTPNYMAPEQVQGKKVDARSDLFALTVIFYEMLTNEKPFAGDTITTVIYRVVNEDPILPCKLNPDLPRSVDQMIEKGLSKSRENRFQTGAEYIDALDALLADPGKPLTFSSDAVKAKGSSSTIVLDKDEAAIAINAGAIKAGPDKRILAGAGAVVVAVIGLLLFFLAGGDRQKPQVDKAMEKSQVVAKVERPEEHLAPEQSIEPEKNLAPEQDKVKQIKPAATSKPAKPPKNKAAKKPVASAKKKARAKITKAVAPKHEKVATPSNKKGLLTVVSDPSGAEVFVGSEFIGLTPVNNLKFRQGGHNLKILKKGYQTYTHKIRLGDKNKFSVSLVEGKSDDKIVSKAAPSGASGALDVFAPPKSVIYIDGKEYKEERVTLSDLSPGSHMVYIQMKGHKPYNKRITITKGKTETIDVR